MNPVEVHEGSGPIILGLPHTGTHVPSEIYSALNEQGRGLDDTDWHIDQLYDDLVPNVTTVRATFHRYVIDANRDPSGVSLYPGQNTTSLIPLTDFDNNPIWEVLPQDSDINQRLEKYHRPYHKQLEAQMQRVKGIHGKAILYDCHSIRSKIPFLFEGILPDFNIGTNGTTTCSTAVETRVLEVCENADGYSTVLNGRFKGGWTTRHYGAPDKGYHAIQMELAQSTYLETEKAPWTYSEQKANKLRLHLAIILNEIEKLQKELL